MKRYSAPCRAILRRAEWDTDEDDARGYERRFDEIDAANTKSGPADYIYNRDEDNVSEMPPPYAMEAEADDAAELAAILEWWNSTM